jgi:hypothetical protein
MQTYSHQSDLSLNAQKHSENNKYYMSNTVKPKRDEQQPTMAMATGENLSECNRHHDTHHDLSRITGDFQSESLRWQKSFKKREKRRRYRRNRNMRRRASTVQPDHAAAGAVDTMNMDDPKQKKVETPTQVSVEESATVELLPTRKKEKFKELETSNPFTSLIDFVSMLSGDMEYCGDALLQEISDLCSSCRQFVDIGMMASESSSLLTPMVQSILDAVYSIGAAYPEKYLGSALNTIRLTNEGLFINYDWCPGIMQFTSPVDTEKFSKDLNLVLANVFDESYFRRTFSTFTNTVTTASSKSSKSTLDIGPGEESSRGLVTTAFLSTDKETPSSDIATDLDSTRINSWYKVSSPNHSSSSIGSDFELVDNYDLYEEL